MIDSAARQRLGQPHGPVFAHLCIIHIEKRETFQAGEVFHAGTTNWVAGLIDKDPFVERITRNVLDRYLA